VTDSWSERPIPTEPADPRAMTKRVPEAAAPDSPPYDPTRPIPSAALPLRPMQQPSYTSPVPSASATQARTPMSSNATGNASDKAKAARKSRAAAKSKPANAAPFIWDSGRVPGNTSPAPQRPQQPAAPTAENAPSAAADGRAPIGPPGAPLAGPAGEPRRRGTRLGLILIGALAVAALLVWVITSTLPKTSPKAPVAIGTTTPSATAKPSPSAAKTTHSAAPTPPTVNVEITDMDDRLVLDVDNSGTSAGTLVGTWAVDNTAAQHWHLVAQPNGTYVIYSELANLKEGLEINTNAKDYSGGTVTTLQSYDDDAAMQWTVKYLSSNEYELVNNDNGQCLTGGGQGVANATSTCNASNAHQAWTLTN
jgi:Ricin-type beta-trefoil lectin domain-like